MFNIENEPLLLLGAAARLVPPGRGGRQTHASTLLRWIKKGTKGPSEERVRLEGYRVGGRWATSRASLERFLEALTPPVGATTTRPLRGAVKRLRMSEQAAERLANIGI
jgi:hypothetical protein